MFFSITTRNIVEFIYVHVLPVATVATVASCHCLVITSPVAVKVKVGHTQKLSTMAKESTEGEVSKKKVLITTGKGLKIYQRQTLSRKR